MTLILSIETATPVCSVALARNNGLLGIKESAKKNSHSEVVTIFIDELLNDTKLNYSDLDAIAVSKGPGSYTGLRIGVSTAKGLCYALDVPLISVNTLQSMSAGMMGKPVTSDKLPTLFCPMIDARRMEVYTAIYNHKNEQVKETSAEIIDENSFKKYLAKNNVVFFGDGSAKCKNVLTHPNAVFVDDIHPSAANMAEIANQKFKENQFEAVAYFEPFYLKEFIAGKPKVKGLK